MNTEMLDRLQAYRENTALFTTAMRNVIPFKTLTDLGLKRSDEAVAKGFVLIRPHISNNSHSKPGLWLAAEDLELLDQKHQELLELQEKLLVKKAQKAPPKPVDEELVMLKKYVHAFKFRTDTTEKLFEAGRRKGFAGGAIASPAQFFNDKVKSLNICLNRQCLSILFSNPEGYFVPSMKSGALTISGTPAIGLTDSFWLKLMTTKKSDDLTPIVSHLEKAFKKFNEQAVAFIEQLPSVYKENVSQQDIIKAISQSYLSKQACEIAPENDPLLRKVLLQMGYNPASSKEVLAETGPLRTATKVKLSFKHFKEVLDRDDLGNILKDARLAHQVLNQIAKKAATQKYANYLRLTEEYLAKQNLTGEAYSAVEICQSNLTKFGDFYSNMVEFTNNIRSRLIVESLVKSLPEKYSEYFPVARSLSRKITFVSGPTNSGKTYEALIKLKQSKKGVYLGPLRLLAAEVYEKLNLDGVPCNLVTGEEVRMLPTATHSSCTVEMFNPSEIYDVAVIDEVQMLFDKDRGGAWLNAILGIAAKEVILIGAPIAKSWVENLAQYLNEPLEIVEKKRLSALNVLSDPITPEDAPDGTAFIVFSRASALALASHIKESTGKGVSVIYGSLPPSARLEQAHLFASGKNPIAVATDAIGMGLNLPIKNVVFTTTVKWNGEEEVAVPAGLVKQIAGRAGRFGLEDAGYVTALNTRSISYIRKCLSTVEETVPSQLYIGMHVQVSNLISERFNTKSIFEVLSIFNKSFRMEGKFRKSISADVWDIAQFLDKTSLSFEQKNQLLFAPATKNNAISPQFISWVHDLAKGRPVSALELQVGRSDSLERLEMMSHACALYTWLSYRFPAVFKDPDYAFEQARIASDRIVSNLSKGLAGNKCQICDVPLNWSSPHKKCDDCFRGFNNYRW